MKTEFKVGQILYWESKNRNLPTEIKESTIEKIGNKYLYLLGKERTPINKENLRYEDKDYLQYYIQFYLDKQDILDKHEREKLLATIQKFFHWSGNCGKCTLNQLRNISTILNLEK